MSSGTAAPSLRFLASSNSLALAGGRFFVAGTLIKREELKMRSRQIGIQFLGCEELRKRCVESAL